MRHPARDSVRDDATVVSRSTDKVLQVGSGIPDPFAAAPAHRLAVDNAINTNFLLSQEEPTNMYSPCRYAWYRRPFYPSL